MRVLALLHYILSEIGGSICASLVASLYLRYYTHCRSSRVPTHAFGRQDFHQLLFKLRAQLQLTHAATTYMCHHQKKETSPLLRHGGQLNDEAVVPRSVGGNSKGTRHRLQLRHTPGGAICEYPGGAICEYPGGAICEYCGCAAATGTP